jgi:hypothetical protein
LQKYTIFPYVIVFGVMFLASCRYSTDDRQQATSNRQATGNKQQAGKPRRDVNSD